MDAGGRRAGRRRAGNQRDGDRQTVIDVRPPLGSISAVQRGTCGLPPAGRTPVPAVVVRRRTEGKAMRMECGTADESVPTRRGGRRWLVVVGWLLTAGALVWAAWVLARSPTLAGVEWTRLRRGDLLLAIGAAATAQLLVSIRWLPLLRAASVPLAPLDAAATAAMADAIGCVALGSTAADVYRIAAGSRRCGGHRLALASVVLADRVAGLLAVIWLAVVGITLAVAGGSAWHTFRAASLPVLWGAALVGAVAVAAALSIDLRPLLEPVCRGPWSRRLVLPLLAVGERFRARPAALVGAFLTSLVTHALNATVVWSLAGALGLPRPSWLAQCLITALATCTGVLPLPLGGLGAVELVAEELTRTALADARGTGLVATLAARLVSLVVAAVCAGLLALVSRRAAR